MNRLLACACAAAALLGSGAVSASAVPVTVPRIVINDGYTLRAEGVVTSPAAATSCVAIIRAQLQVIDQVEGYWRVVRALGSHRLNVCRNGNSGRTYAPFYVRWSGMQYLRSQDARICWRATQNVNGVPSNHISCKQFYLHGGS